MTKATFRPRPARRSELRLALAADHAGYELKEHLHRVLEREGVGFEDLGPYDTETVDYPDFALRVASGVADGSFSGGLLCCGSGQGMAIAANRFPGVRATLCLDADQARMARLHNDSNVLVLPGRLMSARIAEDVVRQWLDTEFEGGRHQRRLEKIDEAARGHARRDRDGEENEK